MVRRCVNTYTTATPGFDEDKRGDGSDDRDSPKDNLYHVGGEPVVCQETNKDTRQRPTECLRFGRTCLHSNLVISTQQQLSKDDPNQTPTIKVLSVQLLDELEHHPVSRPFPQSIARRETLYPGCLAAFVLGFDRFRKFSDVCFHHLGVDRDRIELCNYSTRLVNPLRT